MKNKKLTISGLTVSLLLGLAVTSFAGAGIPGNNPNIGTEAGVDIVASQKAQTAAARFNYQVTQLARVGTEGGADVIASNSAKNAAKSYNYSAEQLAWVGTEAGQAPTGLSVDRSFFNTGTVAEQVAEKCIKESRFSQTC